MQQITILIEDEQQAQQIVEMLSDFDTVQSVDVDPLWTPPGNHGAAAIQIVESEMGPLISESRVSVYDVMEAYDEGYSPRQICELYNLSVYQVEVALEYIRQHRVRLEPELKEIQTVQAAREQHYRTLAAERDAQIPSTMTPARTALKNKLAESRRQRGDD